MLPPCENSLNHTEALRDTLEAALHDMETELFIFSENAKRLPNTSFIAVPDAASQTLLMALDLEGVWPMWNISFRHGPRLEKQNGKLHNEPRR